MAMNADLDDPFGRIPEAYFITFHTYGTWLHGTHRGSVTRERSTPDTPVIEHDESWERERTNLLRFAPMILNPEQRAVVERTVREVCKFRGWTLIELSVRTNHIHVVVNAATRPERVMNDMKSYATRRLREANAVTPGRAIWQRHGSTRYLWNERSVALACEYVREGQGPDTH